MPAHIEYCSVAEGGLSEEVRTHAAVSRIESSVLTGPKTLPKLCFVVTEDWYFVSHRLPLAIAAREAGYEVTVITRVREHGDVIRRAGLQLIPFENARGSINPLGELWTLIRLVRLNLKVRPDIAHNVAIKPVLYGSIAARLAGTRRVVNAVAGMGWLFSERSWTARVIKRIVGLGLRVAFQRGTIIVQNPDDERALTALGVPERRIRRIAGSGVDLRAFAPVPEPDGRPVIVLPARLLWSKGVGEFIAAAQLLREWHVDALCVLAGEPDEANPEAVPRQQLDKWIEGGVVEYRGWVKDMPQLLRTSHIICLPSYREGIPKSLIEAAAAGKPIVTTNVPGCREVVRHGENGFLVPPRDSRALADALATLARNRELRTQMGASGRARAEREFGIESVVQKTLKVYAEMLK